MGACSSKEHLVAKGEACFLATDCEPGLVCVPQDNGTRICSDDLTKIAGDTPPEAGPPMDANPDAPEGGNDAPNDGPPPNDTGADTGEKDSATDAPTG